MNHRKIVDEIVQSCAYYSKKDLPDLVIHELRHLGLNTNDYQKCEEELKKIIADG